MDDTEKGPTKAKRPRKRVKLKCLSCGSVFDDDYLPKHEKAKHRGEKVKTELHDIPANPFEAARLYASKKYETASFPSSATVSVSPLNPETVENPKPAESPKTPESSKTAETAESQKITEDPKTAETKEKDELQLESIEYRGEHFQSETIETPPQDDELNDSDSSGIAQEPGSSQSNFSRGSLVMNNAGTASVTNQDKTEVADVADESWVLCAGKLIRLTNCLEECRCLIPISNDDMDINPILFLTKSLDAVKKIAEKAQEYVKSSELALNEYLEKLDNFESEMRDDEIVPHDPAFRPKRLTDNQKFYLISLGAHQPVLSRYPTNFEIKNPNKQRCFSSKWYEEYPQLEYSLSKDAAFCFACYLFPTGPDRAKAEGSWTEKGVRTWDKMKSRGTQKLGKLKAHFNSAAHKAALADYCHFLNPAVHIDNTIRKRSQNENIQLQSVKEYNKEVITILFDTARTLSRQGLAFRGSDDDKNGNFRQILELIGRHNAVMDKWLNDRNFTAYTTAYLSPKFQNEFINLLAYDVTNIITKEVNESKMFSVMADTTPDMSHDDQLSVVVRYVGQSGEAIERILDFIKVTDKTGAGLAATILDSLQKNRINTDDLLFQSYDYANSMSGLNRGTQKMLSDLLKRNIPYIPCQAHRLNTFVEHSCNASSIISNMFNTLESLYVFFTSSTKRNNVLKNKMIEVENALQLTNLSKTRWIAKAQSLRAVWASYDAILDIFDEIVTGEGDFDAKTKGTALSLQNSILNFDFIVSMMFMKNIMYKCKNLTESLESVNLNVLDAITLIKSTNTSFKLILESESEIQNLITSAKEFACQKDVDPEADFAKHHRRRLLPRRFDSNTENAAVFTLEIYFAKEFKEVLNTLVNKCNDNLQEFINVIKPLFDVFSLPFTRDSLKKENVAEMLKLVPNSPFSDVDSIFSELEILADNCQDAKSQQDVCKISEKLKTILPSANYFCRVVNTAPCSVASNERGFSPLKYIKGPLRTTMNQERLKSLMILHTQRDLLDQIDLKKVVEIWYKLKVRRVEM